MKVAPLVNLRHDVPTPELPRFRVGRPMRMPAQPRAAQPARPAPREASRPRWVAWFGLIGMADRGAS